MHIYIYIYVYIYMCAYIHMCTYVYMRIYVYAYVCVSVGIWPKHSSSEGGSCVRGAAMSKVEPIQVRSVGDPLEVLAVGPKSVLCRPCADCGLFTGRFCDWCMACDRIPSEQWARGQHTPLCSRCDWRWGCCRFCRGVSSCTPPASGPVPKDDEE